METLISPATKVALERYARDNETLRYRTPKTSADHLHARGRGWIAQHVIASVQKFYDANRKRGRASREQMDDSVTIISNGQALNIKDLLNVLEHLERSTKVWVSTQTIESLLLFSRALNYYRNTPVYYRHPNLLQVLGPAAGLDFFVEGSYNNTRARSRFASTLATERVDVLAQLVRYAEQGQEAPAPYADAIRLATMAHAQGRCKRLIDKILTRRALWRNGELPDRNAEVLLREAAALSGWSVLLVFYGDDTHWRLLLVLAHGTDDRVSHIIYDPLYRFTQHDSPGSLLIGKNDEAEEGGDVEYVMSVLRGMATLGYPGVFDGTWPIIIEGATPGQQKDGWTCGWRAFLYFERIVEHFSREPHAEPILDDDADVSVLALFERTRKATQEEEREFQGRSMKECVQLREELLDLIRCTLALAYHTLDELIKKTPPSPY